MNIDHAAFGTVAPSSVLHHANGMVWFGFTWLYHMLGGAQRNHTRTLHGHSHTVRGYVTRHFVLLCHLMHVNVVNVQILWICWSIGEWWLICELPLVCLWVFTSLILYMSCRDIDVRNRSGKM